MYITKSIIVEAIRWTGSNLEDIIRFAGEHVAETNPDIVDYHGLEVYTVVGKCLVEKGQHLVFNRTNKKMYPPLDNHLFVEFFERFKTETTK